MLTFKEFLCEWSIMPKGIDKHMQKLGYKKLGAGVDQTAWMKPGEETIIKIFGTDENRKKRSKHSEGHLMFKWWANYCKKNSSNPFLPKFEGWEAFEYKGEKFLQIKMEQLEKIPGAIGEVGDALENVLAYWGVQRNKRDGQRGLKKELKLDNPYDRQIDGKAQLMMLLGEKNFYLLYDTIVELAKVGRKKDWGIDLHKGNFMYRNDGTPVIVDPFVI